MKTFIRLGDAFLIPVATITGVVLEDPETVSIRTSDHDPFDYVFDSQEEAKAEFERISKLLLNPQRAVSATEVPALPGVGLKSLGSHQELDQLNDNEYVERLANTFERLGLIADADRLKKLQLVES